MNCPSSCICKSCSPLIFKMAKKTSAELHSSPASVDNEPSLQKPEVNENKLSGFSRTHPTWNSTFGPIQKKQSTTRNAKIIGMLFMYLPTKSQIRPAGQHIEDTYKLKNQGSEATDSCTSTSWKCSWITGRHRVTRDSNTRWSRRVPCMDGL